ncbi:SET domain-containing protein [Flavobacterium jejuense]|uniref:SET domain-containing protein n=1 Tax=Flavobacterium jejuense TaxID=1544455 RepID=A0ABX0IRK9_9FLAO|nr:SET domain-containing protein-lysine N-methyltransferase [Flavobacterium jejuense]NHN24761.1 SET domain-containing protein [Flavobacterium jejuense]
MSNKDNTIEVLESDYLYVQTSQLPNAGNGLFTAITIYKDEIISYFDGEILTDSEIEKRKAANQDQYFINRVEGGILDSMHTDCFAKYANDAKGIATTKFKNNAIISLDENKKICIIATKKIKQGEEIFCSYGTPYWSKHKKIIDID